MEQKQINVEKHQGLKNLIKLGILTLSVTSSYRLLFGAIKHGSQVYEDGEESAPIITKRDEGLNWRIVKQILIGKQRGGRILTETRIIFKHEPGKNDRKTTSQRLRVGKAVTLTDGTTAEGE